MFITKTEPNRGTMKADVTEDIPVQSGVSSYYSSLGKVDFYDGDNGRQFTTRCKQCITSN